ncbi:N-acetylmuramoyl-L-alanine amidase [Butyricicoccus sp. 1XD8-22]|nr:N-acetylmuramoyl-L-alanine amidase [Butyricicoccus sp. 1XD8-22]
MGYTNSSLATVKLISPNKNSPRNKPLDIITIHCFVGQVTAKRGCEVFQPTSKNASCNYVVGLDGGIGLCVEEKDRSWCTSSAANDNRAVTIEVASDTAHPYAVTAKAYAALLDLVTDICRRNGKRKLLWLGDKAKTLAYKPAADEMLLTVHRWYAAKACPGEYLFSRQAAIAEEVTKRLGGASAPTPAPPNTATDFESYTVRVTATNLNIRKGAGTNFHSAGYIKPGVYTIVEEADGKGATRWGKLKSGMGWISLDYAKKV